MYCTKHLGWRSLGGCLKVFCWTMLWLPKGPGKKKVALNAGSRGKRGRPNAGERRGRGGHSLIFRTMGGESRQHFSGRQKGSMPCFVKPAWLKSYVRTCILFLLCWWGVNRAIKVHVAPNSSAAVTTKGYPCCSWALLTLCHCHMFAFTSLSPWMQSS